MYVIREDHGVRVPGLLEAYWKRWGLVFEFIYTGQEDEDKLPWMLHAHFLVFSLFLHFPCSLIPNSKKEKWRRDWQCWGFAFFEDAIHFYWGEHAGIWYLPIFHKVFQRHEVLRADGSWVPFVGTWEQDKEPDGRAVFTAPYAYKLENGTIQLREASVYVERWAWRPKWLQWTRAFESVRQCIEVTFSDEVGERRGSWKGGCIACGYDMLPGETPQATLRRMQRERKFK